jgi:cysteine desulfurase
MFFDVIRNDPPEARILAFCTSSCRWWRQQEADSMVDTRFPDAAMQKDIYLDNNATTPVLPEVLEAMLPFFRQRAGNPSSRHLAGLTAHSAIEDARAKVAELVGAPPSHVLFTSSATEAINTAFHSALRSRLPADSKIVLTTVEHAAVSQCALAARQLGATVVQVPVSQSGELAFDQLAETISNGASLVSVMWANNETGVIFPIPRIAELCEDRGVPLHVDAVQAAGKVPINLEQAHIDYLSLSAHKLFGPKGAGALVASPSIVNILLRGGNQEEGKRAGTENVPAIVGFGEAARLAVLELEQRTARTALLRDRLERVLFQTIEGCYINGVDEPRIPNTTNLGFNGIDGNMLADTLDAANIYVSTGSACKAGTLSPSHVVMSMTGSFERAAEAVRFSLSHFTTEVEIDRTISVVEKSITSLRLMQTAI